MRVYCGSKFKNLVKLEQFFLKVFCVYLVEKCNEMAALKHIPVSSLYLVFSTDRLEGDSKDHFR